MEQIVELENLDLIRNLFGNFDENMKRIETVFGVSVVNRGGEVKLSGEEAAVAGAKQVLLSLAELAMKGEIITPQNVDYFISAIQEGDIAALSGLGSDCICITSKGKPIKPKTLGQKNYVEAIRGNTVTLGVGPAGTGKTYLAVAMAVTVLRAKQISRIVLTRPAVEAGEKLGFLPGDLQDKVDPYLRPLHDALFDLLGVETYRGYLEKGVIEIAPLAYMRGRTLDDSFILLDEAQNTTCEQMKMFLTRLGFRSKIVITGDITQIDLPAGKQSGLKQAMGILNGIEDIAVCRLTDRDVVRHSLVQKIIRAYDAAAEAPTGGRKRKEYRLYRRKD